jgi:PAS domain S-box-containing protein
VQVRASARQVSAYGENCKYRYRSLFETSPDAIFLLRGSLLIDCNPATSVIFAGDKHSLVGKTILALSPPDQPNGERSSVLAGLMLTQAENFVLQTFKWTHTAMDGRLFDAEVRLRPFGSDGGEPCLLCLSAI